LCEAIYDAVVVFHVPLVSQKNYKKKEFSCSFRLMMLQMCTFCFAEKPAIYCLFVIILCMLTQQSKSFRSFCNKVYIVETWVKVVIVFPLYPFCSTLMNESHWFLLQRHLLKSQRIYLGILRLRPSIKRLDLKQSSLFVPIRCCQKKFLWVLAVRYPNVI
jgi:hypothetical protein